MMLPYRVIVTAALLAAVATAGCGRREAPPATTGEPAVSQVPAPPAAEPAPAPESADREKRYRDAILSAVVNNPEFGSLIPRAPTLGGSWRVGSREDVEFLGNGMVAVEYEDGHAAGRLVLKVEDPHDPKSWKVIRDEPK